MRGLAARDVACLGAPLNKWSVGAKEHLIHRKFPQRYVNRVHGLSFERGANPKADAGDLDELIQIRKLLSKCRNDSAEPRVP